MINNLRDAPIRTKLVAVIVLVTSLMSIVVALQVLFFEYLSYRENTTQRLTAVADVVAMNTAPALILQDHLAGRESLASLKVESSILAAFIIDERGRVFAKYLNSELYGSEEQDVIENEIEYFMRNGLDPDGWSRFRWKYIDMTRPVMLDESQVGMLYIIASTKALLTRMWLFVVIMSVVTLLSLVTVILISRKLQRFITVPIQRLLVTMKQVAAEENYNLQVKKTNEDELGQLIDGFNAMLSEVRERDDLLKKSRDNLEKEISSRTEQLTRANRNLNIAISELKTAKESAETANVAKSNFLASMSHELRTPLNAVIGFSEVLIDGHYGSLNDDQREYVEDIMTSGQHLLALINDILDITKIEAGQEELNLGNVNLSELIDHSLIMIREKAHKQGVVLSTDIEPAIKDKEIVADQRKLKQVLFNLLSNAAKFTQSGGKIEIRAAAGDGEILISVSDTGAGLESKELEKIFQEFYQTHGGLVNKTTGTGLGLALARKFIHLHGGRIWAESEGLGKGSRFTFSVRTDLSEMHGMEQAL